jgi:hypothetical protein
LPFVGSRCVAAHLLEIDNYGRDKEVGRWIGA